MRWLLVAPGDFIRLIGVVAVIFGLGMAGDQVAGWVRERGLPSDPIERHLVTCPRCAGDAPLYPLDEHGQPCYIYSEMSRLNRPVLIRGIAAEMARASGMPGNIEPLARP
jgi:hypothetical protein